MSKKTLPDGVFEKYENAVLNQYAKGELTKGVARQLLIEFYRDYERQSEDK